MPKYNPILIAMVLLVSIPLAIWLLVLVVGVICSIGNWYGYSISQ
jgi:hypothetical protein